MVRLLQAHNKVTVVHLELYIFCDNFLIIYQIKKPYILKAHHLVNRLTLPFMGQVRPCSHVTGSPLFS